MENKNPTFLSRNFYICRMRKIRHYENLHIPLWLLKDTCWMLQWKALGMIMIIPTVTVALLITYRTWKVWDDEFWINLAICFWISANSYWMICEFAGREEIKDYAGFPFLAGMLCVAWFYIKRLVIDKGKKDILD
jgi:hypothetical protein